MIALAGLVDEIPSRDDVEDALMNLFSFGYGVLFGMLILAAGGMGVLDEWQKDKTIRAARKEMGIVNAVERRHLNQKGVTNMQQIPTIGRIVHYRLSLTDASAINRRRTTGVSIATRMKTFAKSADDGQEPVYGWPEGAQAHIGNEVKEGDVFPMMITRVWGNTPTSAVNGQAYLDGNDVLWVTSATVGDQLHQFSWMNGSFPPSDGQGSL